MAGFLRRPYQPELGQNVQKFLPWLVYQVATEPLYHMQFSNRILIPNILDSNHINTPKLEHVCVMYGRRVQSLFSIDKDENTHENKYHHFKPFASLLYWKNVHQSSHESKGPKFK